MKKGVKQAQETVTHASVAGDALQSITNSISSISDMNTQIASASEQQTIVAEEINRNIVNITEVSEQTSGGARQTASSSQSLTDLANDLQQTVNRFKISSVA